MTRSDAGDLTVVIPTRSRWEILRRTLGGLREQSLPGAEVIVVIDGEDLEPPDGLAADRVLQQPHGGPGRARNLGAGSTDRPLVLFLGDDMVPDRDLVAHHLRWHDRRPEEQVAVLGHVDWHPEVADDPLLRWLDRAGLQFDYAAMGAQSGQDVGFGRFYSCNVSLKADFFRRAGGFDPDFLFTYEDLDAGWRLGQGGMELLYEPAARTAHLHAYDLDAIRRRFEAIALGERLMATKHDWFDPPFFHQRVTRAAAHPKVHRVWRQLADRWPAGAPMAAAVRRRGDTWWLQQVAEPFLTAWERSADVAELYTYLGEDFDPRLIAHANEAVNAEASAVGDELAFYRTSTTYLYDLTVFGMSGVKDPYHAELRRHVRPGARLLDYGCGIGADGLRLLGDGYDVTFADFDNPSTTYLRWRLEQRGIAAPVLDIESDPVPTGFDAAYAFDVIEHVPDPHAFLDVLERAADVVVVNLLEEDDHHHERDLHHELPIAELVRRARQRGLLSHTTWHGGHSHLLVYRGRTVRN